MTQFTKQTKSMQIILLISLTVLALILVGLGPLITIWSLNTVFGLNIAYTFWTWLGTLVLSSAVYATKR